MSIKVSVSLLFCWFSVTWLMCCHCRLNAETLCATVYGFKHFSLPAIQILFSPHLHYNRGKYYKAKNVIKQALFKYFPLHNIFKSPLQMKTVSRTTETV